MERETGIEPATNSLEGCDSTTELLPPTRLARFASLGATAGKPAFARKHPTLFHCLSTVARFPAPRARRWIGEGRIRTFEAARATDLQSAAFDRFATSPGCVCVLECVASD